MKSLKDGFGYNERLFSGGIRQRLHIARFDWLRRELIELGCSYSSVIELGCFDGKLIALLPVKPMRYAGFDANWEGGLDAAVKRWRAYPEYSFQKVLRASDMSLRNGEVFDIAVVMETFEHIPPELVGDYLAMLSRHLKGYLFVTVPNEKGVVFLAKWLVKKMFGKDSDRYTMTEAINATFGRMHLVSRNEHKGFDYRRLIEQIDNYFDVVKISGHPLSFLPTSFCFGVGILARTKHAGYYEPPSRGRSRS